jgi:hypothetical protein
MVGLGLRAILQKKAAGLLTHRFFLTDPADRTSNNLRFEPAGSLTITTA